MMTGERLARAEALLDRFRVEARSLGDTIPYMLRRSQTQFATNLFALPATSDIMTASPETQAALVRLAVRAFVQAAESAWGRFWDPEPVALGLLLLLRPQWLRLL